MITITANDMLNSIGTFKEISEKPIQIKGAYAIARLIRELDKESTTFDESRRKIVEKYCQRDDSGEIKTNEDGNVFVQEDKVTEFNDELKSLLETELEINADKIKLDTLGDIELSPLQIVNITPFIED